MSLTTKEKQISNRILSKFSGEERRRIRKLTDTLEEAGGASEIPGVDYRIRLYLPNPLGALVPTVGSGVVTAVGSASAGTRTNTNRLTRASAANYAGTAASASSIGGFFVSSSANQGDAYLLPNTEGGGFIYKGVFGGRGFTVSTARMFTGYCSRESGSPFTDVEPSSLTNILGIGFDSADTEVQFIHNDASGTATKIPLGASFPKPTADDANMYSLRMESSADGTSVSYVVEDLIAGVSASGVVSTDLPAGTVSLGVGGYVSAGGTSTQSTIRVVGITEISPNIW